MADLPYIQEAQEVKITGQDSTGATVNYVGADSNGNIKAIDYADGVTGSVVPTVSMQIAGSDGTLLRTLLTDTSGRLNVNQGTAGTASGAWFEKITDGTNIAAVAAASTAPTATQSALIVVQSPNGNQATATLQTTGNTSLTSIQSTSNSTAVNTSDIAANQTNGTQRTLITDLVGNLQPSGDSPARTVYVKLNDGTNSTTNTTINSKIRLDVNLSSEGIDGTTAPFGAQQIAGKDSGGNLQTISTDTNGVIQTSTKIALTFSSPTAVSVGVASTSILAINTNRKGLILINTSVNTISISFNGAAVLNSGITLFPGGTFVMDEFMFSTAAVTGIASAISSNISVQEID